jgi:ferredoxin-NADP reductase
MERAALRRRLNWQVGTVIELVEETARTKSIVLDLPDWQGHRAGQHVDVRLTAEDGYQAQRSYSIASAPEDEHLALTVERLEDGEVSPYLVDELRSGDDLELRGPVGGYFVWESSLGGPLLLVGGGSGVVPFRSMLRHHRATENRVPVRLVYSARSLPELIYRDELMRIAADGEIDIRFTLTREQPPSWRGYARRIDRDFPQRGRVAGRRAPACIRVRPNRIRRDRGERPRRTRTRTRQDQDRTVRTDMTSVICAGIDWISVTA